MSQLPPAIDICNGIANLEDELNDLSWISNNDYKGGTLSLMQLGLWWWCSISNNKGCILSVTQLQLWK